MQHDEGPILLNRVPTVPFDRDGDTLMTEGADQMARLRPLPTLMTRLAEAAAAVGGARRPSVMYEAHNGEKRRSINRVPGVTLCAP